MNVFKTDKPILNFKIQTNDELVESEIYESYYLVLANIHNPKYNIDKEIVAFADFLKGKDLEKLASDYMGSEKYMAAIRTVEDLTKDEDLIGYYDYEEAKEQVLREAKAYAMKTGHEEGLKTEFEQGIEKGAKQNAIEVAKKMFGIPNITVEQIAECTSLSLEEIEKMKEEA